MVLLLLLLLEDLTVFLIVVENLMVFQTVVEVVLKILYLMNLKKYQGQILPYLNQNEKKTGFTEDETLNEESSQLLQPILELSLSLCSSRGNGGKGGGNNAIGLVQKFWPF